MERYFDFMSCSSVDSSSLILLANMINSSAAIFILTAVGLEDTK